MVRRNHRPVCGGDRPSRLTRAGHGQAEAVARVEGGESHSPLTRPAAHEQELRAQRDSFARSERGFKGARRKRPLALRLPQLGRAPAERGVGEGGVRARPHREGEALPTELGAADPQGLPRGSAGVSTLWRQARSRRVRQRQADAHLRKSLAPLPGGAGHPPDLRRAGAAGGHGQGPVAALLQSSRRARGGGHDQQRRVGRAARGQRRHGRRCEWNTVALRRGQF